MPSQQRLRCPARQEVGTTLAQRLYTAAAASHLQSVVAAASPIMSQMPDMEVP